MNIQSRRACYASVVVAVMVGAGVGAAPGFAAGTTGHPGAAHPAVRAAKHLDGLSLAVAPQDRTSSTHKRLYVLVNASRETHNHTETSVSLSRSGTPETHEWTFQITKASFSFNIGTGKGSLSTGKQLKPFGKLALSFNTTGKKHTQTCGTYVSVSQAVTVHGALSFNSKTKGKKGWGKVGGSDKHTLSGKSHVYYQTGAFACCGGGFTNPCSAGVEWNASTQVGTKETQMFGSLNGSHGFLEVSRNASLKKPKGAIRTDAMNVPDNNVSFASHGGNATLSIGATKHVTGSAKLASTSAGTSYPSTCGKHHKTMTTTTWQAPYMNGSSPLKVHEQIEGALALPDIPVSANSTSLSKTTVS